MSLQTRLAALIAAVGADIKADRLRLTALEGASAKQVQQGWMTGNYSSLSAGVRPATKFLSFTVLPGTYVVHASLSGYVAAATPAAYNVYAEHPNGTFSNPIVTVPFHLNSANVHTTFPPASGEIVVTTAGTLRIWPGVGALTTDTSDVFCAVVIPKDMAGPIGPTGPTGPQGIAGSAPASYTMDPWHNIGAAGEPTMGASWVNFDNSLATPSATAGHRNAGYKKDPFGVVQLRGVIKNGTAPGTVFTLPSGYRPVKDQAFVRGAGVGLALINISASTGAVSVNNYLASGTNAYVYLDDIEFDTGLITTFLSGPKGDTGDIGLPPIVVKARHTTSYSPSGGTYFGVGWNTEDADTNSIWDGTKFQPTRAGWYEITAALPIDNASGTSSDLNMYLVKNRTGTYPATGTTEAQDTKRIFPAQGETLAKLELTQVVYFNGTTDFVEVYINFTNGRVVGSTANTFGAVSVGAVGPAGATGPTGPAGPAGSDGSAVAPQQIPWEEMEISSTWVKDADAPPAWMLSTDGIVFVRGLLTAHTGATGITLIDVSSMFSPYTSPVANLVRVPGVNLTQGVVGFWEILDYAMVWHGAVADGDVLGLDGVSWPSAVGGPLGTLVTPSFASGWGSDPTNPLKVWKTDSELRFSGGVIGPLAASPAVTTMFSVSGLPAHARVVQGNALVETTSGTNHPTSTGMTYDDFAATSAGAVQAIGQFGGANQVKITFNGGFTKEELE